MGYLIPKPSLQKNSSNTIWPIAGGNKGVHTFLKDICSKVNSLPLLDFEHAYFNTAIYHFNHYAMGSPPIPHMKYQNCNVPWQSYE